MPTHTMCIVVHGRVQGVYFRKYAQGHAITLGLTGFTRNGDSGDSVEIEAQGSQQGLNEFLNLIRTGPRRARVTKVTFEWKDSSETFRRFEVRH